MAKPLIHNKYNILEPLGHGGMGTVYRAMHEGLKREVALKKLHEQYAKDPDFVERFMREARAMARLDHPNIIRIYDVLAENDANYIAMEYFPGGSLAARLAARNHLDQEAVILIIKQVGSALAYAHKRGIVHRDIKPGNILIKSKNTVKIADFGIAAVTDEHTLTFTGEVVGSPRYMCPEQARGKGTDQRSDLFSLGMVFYQMLTGATVFDGDSGVAIIGKLAFSEEELVLEFPAKISVPIQDIVIKLLQRNAGDRFQSADDLLDALNRLDNSQVEKISIQKKPAQENTSKDKTPDIASSLSPSMMGAQTISLVLPGKRANAQRAISMRVATTSVTNASPAAIIAIVLALTLTVSIYYFLSYRDDKPGNEQSIGIPSTQKNQDEPREERRRENNQAPTSIPSEINREIETKKQLVEKDAENVDDPQDKNTQIADSVPVATNVASKEDAILVAKLDADLVILDQAIKVVEAHKRGVDTAAAMAYAAQEYTKAEQEWLLLLNVRGQAEQAKNDKNLMQSQQLIDDSFALSEQTIAAYSTAKASAEENRLLAEIGEDINLLDALIERTKTAKDKAINATKAEASATVIELFERATDEEGQGGIYRVSVEQQLAQRDIGSARQVLHQAYNKYQAALRLYNKVSNAPVTVTASVGDFKILQDLFETLRTAYAQKDIATLQETSRMSAQRLVAVKKIFDRYVTIDVSIADIRLGKNSATASLVINQLGRRDGSITLPADRWKTAALEIKKKEDGWDKIQW